LFHSVHLFCSHHFGPYPVASSTTQHLSYISQTRTAGLVFFAASVARRRRGPLPPMRATAPPPSRPRGCASSLRRSPLRCLHPACADAPPLA
jgi:hypothetical protein